MEWEYNDASAWGLGYFARYNASPAAPPSGSVRGIRDVAGLEKVGAAERVFASRDGTITAVALGAFEGGHVGFVGDVNLEAATAKVVAALVDAAPGVGAPAAQRQRQVRGTGGWLGVGASRGGGTEQASKLEGSMAVFVCYAVCSMTITSVFVALLAWLILK